MHGSNTPQFAIPRSNRPVSWLVSATLTVGVIAAIVVSQPAHADYQQTLAAKGADAYAPASDIIAIEPGDLDETFAQATVVAEPALSDQEVMIDLQSRITSEDHLQAAAENLAPEAEADLKEEAEADLKEEAIADSVAGDVGEDTTSATNTADAIAAR